MALLPERSSRRFTARDSAPKPRGLQARYRPAVENLEERVHLAAGSAAATAAALAAGLPGRIAPVVDNLLATGRIPGMGVAVDYDGNVVLDQGYGVIGDSARSPVTAATPFQVGSVTKTFTAIAVLMIAEQPGLIDKATNPGVELLRINAPIGAYLPAGVPIRLPSLPRGQTFVLPRQWAGLTLRQLLDMSSGLRDDLTNTPWNKVVQNLVRHGETAPAFKPPGSRYLYSDLGFQLLGALIEKLTGESYAQFVEQHILDPLGMTETTVLTGSQTSVPGQAIGYASYNPRNNQGDVPAEGHYTGADAYSAAGIVSSATDLAKYMSALWNQSSKLLSASGYRQMWTPVPLVSESAPHALLTPGLGWDGVVATPGGPTAWKIGSVPGYQAEISMSSSDGLAIAVAFNLNNPGFHRRQFSAEQVVDAIHAAVLSALEAER
jgi:D-alanyl-D-alanine carboxypeptidase